MSVSAPVRADVAAESVAAQSPVVEVQPKRPAGRGSPDWLPVIGWFVDEGPLHTRINVIPTANTTDPSERFMVVLKFFRGEQQPVYTHMSDAFSGDDNFRFESAELLQALGETSFDGLVEITARSLERGPAHFPWVDSWIEFYADDGSFSGSVPGFVFKGGTTKRVMSGKWQHWPGVAVNEEYASTLLLLNYHPRPVDVRLDLFSPSGRLASSEVLQIQPQRPWRLDIEVAVPGARELLAREGGFGSLRIWSSYKLPGFVAMRNRRGGCTVSFDHTVPFAGPPVG